jgi:hypothetical protein
MIEPYFSYDVAAHPFALILPTVRFSRKREKHRRLAIFWHGDFPTGRSQTVYGGNTPWRLLVEKVAVAGIESPVRRAPALSRFEIRMGDHLLLVPDAKTRALTDSSAYVKLVAVVPAREEAIARAKAMSRLVLVAKVAIIGYADYGASAGLSWSAKDGTTQFTGGSVDL